MRFSLAALSLLAVLPLLGCGPGWPPPGAKLAEERAKFQTTLVRKENAGYPVDPPPAEVFQVVQYSSPVGPLAAYLTPDPGDGQKHPAILWIVGGFDNSIGDMWSPATPDNDQTAAAFRQAGIVMMVPSLRGGNQNPGHREVLYGEVDDVLGAAEFLAAQSYVDPSRIYLGGHSTGGTLALLAAASSNRFRAVFSLGPAHDVAGYGREEQVWASNLKERRLRSPKYWLENVTTPTFVVEGSEQPSNADAIHTMDRLTDNQHLHFLAVPGADHFSILAPINGLLAQKLLSDTGPTCSITLTAPETTAAVGH